MARIDPDDPLYQPVTLQQALQITGRSRDTIERWVRQRKLTRYEASNDRRVAYFIEGELLEVEHQTRTARGGRPPKQGPEAPQLDVDQNRAPS